VAETFDVVVLGAGMAGASLAAHLSASLKVALLEREDQPGRHATGRSTAIYSETYGNAMVRALSKASRPFFESPPAGFTGTPLIRPRGVIHVARGDQIGALRTFFAAPDVAAVTCWLDAAEARALSPAFREDQLAAAVHEPGAEDLDVNALHQAYLRLFRRNGGRLILEADVTGLAPSGKGWRIETSADRFSAGVVVNAAGAWADTIAGMAGLAEIGLEPRRRTVLRFDPPSGVDISAWPVAIDVDEQFYFKPDAGLLLLTPADETPSPPCDAQPEEVDVAIAIDRLQRATRLEVQQVRSRWAGLRTFAPDRTPVVGYDHQAKGFFWLAGQGGYGIQTAPALSRLAAALVKGEAPPADILACGVSIADLSPARF
jgi:D-arginine dehydrogenase